MVREGDCVSVSVCVCVCVCRSTSAVTPHIRGSQGEYARRTSEPGEQKQNDRSGPLVSYLALTLKAHPFLNWSLASQRQRRQPALWQLIPVKRWMGAGIRGRWRGISKIHMQLWYSLKWRRIVCKVAQARASVLDSCGQYCSGDKSSLGESLSHLKRLRQSPQGEPRRSASRAWGGKWAVFNNDITAW